MAQPYPTPRPNGRGSDRPVLPHRRRLRPPQSEGANSRLAQEALGLGDHRSHPLAAASWRGVGVLLLARYPEVFLSSAGEEAQALRMEPLRGRSLASW